MGKKAIPLEHQTWRVTHGPGGADSPARVIIFENACETVAWRRYSLIHPLADHTISL
jgi:hypothetical protein